MTTTRTTRPRGRRRTLDRGRLRLAAAGADGTAGRAGVHRAAADRRPEGGPSGQLQPRRRDRRHERGASRLYVFGVVAQDRATVQYTLDGDGTAASCKLIGNTGALGIVQVPLKRAAFACDYRRDGAALPQRLDLRGGRCRVRHARRAPRPLQRRHRPWSSCSRCTACRARRCRSPRRSAMSSATKAGRSAPSS